MSEVGPVTRFDVAVIGSGFGGSVAALRLAQQGLKVVVVEQGRRIRAADMEAAAKHPHRFMWAPRLGMNGYFSQVFLRHVTVVRGVALGGGSIVYAAVLLEPGRGFYEDPTLQRLGVDWYSELQPHFATAKRMLGVSTCPSSGKMDRLLQATATAMGPTARDTFGAPPLGIYFGDAGQERPDPFFGGRGPSRTGCRLCGQCLGGCPHGSKNSLDKNYLHLAEQLGVVIRTRHRAETIRPLSEGGYEVRCTNTEARNDPRPPIIAGSVVVAAGAIGTLELLLKCRDQDGTLPNVSRTLGTKVRTNSEAIVAITSREADEQLSSGGPAISSHFYANERTHITNNRFPQAMNFMRFQVGPLVDKPTRGSRALEVLKSYVLHPGRATIAMRSRDWHRRVSVLTVMQDLDNELRLEWTKNLLGGWSLSSRTVPGKNPPSYIPEANQAARHFARASGGIPGNGLIESMAGGSTTAHILGGCPMGRDRNDGVIDVDHQVFGHPGLYVVDGSCISANVGVNPSLTITAMAERFGARFSRTRSG